MITKQIEADSLPGIDLINLHQMIENKDTNFYTDITPEFPDFTIKENLNSALIDTSVDVPEPPAAAMICSNGSDKIFATLGDFSLWIGKSKSKKTFLITAMMAAHSGKTILNITGKLPDDKCMALLFDCEQSIYYAHKTAKRVLRLIGSDVKTFKAFSLRKYEPATRLEMIEYSLYHTPNIGLAAIDGIRDLIRDINSPEEATMIASKLLKWTEELNIHIICVLHMNKGDNNARGHVGTELINKAQNVISVAKDEQNPEFSIVTNEYARDIEFEPFAFFIDDLGLPELVQNYTPKSNKKGAQTIVKPELMSLEQHNKILQSVFNQEDELTYSRLWHGIKAAFADTGIKIADNKAKEIVGYYKKITAINLKGTHGTVNARYILAQTL